MILFFNWCYYTGLKNRKWKFSLKGNCVYLYLI